MEASTLDDVLNKPGDFSSWSIVQPRRCSAEHRKCRQFSMKYLHLSCSMSALIRAPAVVDNTRSCTILHKRRSLLLRPQPFARLRMHSGSVGLEKEGLDVNAVGRRSQEKARLHSAPHRNQNWPDSNRERGGVEQAASQVCRGGCHSTWPSARIRPGSATARRRNLTDAELPAAVAACNGIWPSAPTRSRAHQLGHDLLEVDDTRRIHGYAQLVYATTGQPPRVGPMA